MNLTTLKKFSITLCMLLLAFGISFAQNSTVTPNWDFSCTDDNYVEIVGTGTQTPGAPPSTLNISNVATVDSILVEIIFKGPAGTSPQAAIIQTSNGDSIFNNSPVMLPSLGSNHVAGAYRTMVSAASTISAYVTPPNTALHTWAMIAYVYRSGNGIGSTSAGVYAQPLVLNTNWIFHLPIPVTPAPKTVEILTPIVELDNAIDRMAIVTVSTAGISQSDTLMVPNAGTSLNMNTIILNNVPAAADKVTVNFISPSNGIGDSFIGSAMVTVNNSCASTLGLVVDAKMNVTCAGGNDGSIDVHGVNGIPPYTYLWNDGVTTEDRSNLSAGTYTVTVTDSQGSTASKTKKVNTPAQLKLSISKSNLLCNNDQSGALDLTVTKGISPYTYAWNDGSTNEDRQNLGSGTYTVTVTDANGCTRQISKSIAQPRLLRVLLDKTDNTCFESMDGIINTTVKGGTKPYTYLWNDGITTEDRQNLSKGKYTLMVTDANGCSATKRKFILRPEELIVSSTITNANCFGENNGAISLSVTGGNGGNTYAWNNGAAAQNIIDLIAGTYDVEVTDVKGCKTTKSIVVAQPDALVLTTTSTDALCFGDNNGAASVTATGGVQNYAYSWSNGASVEQATNLIAGTYSVLVTDAHGCTAIENATIVEPMQMVLGSSTIDVTCNGGTDGEASASVAGGTAPFSYEWNNGNTSALNQNLTAGTYTVTATDANGCLATSNVTIAEPLAMSAFILNTNVSCKNGNNGTAEVLVGNGQAPYTYTWSTGATTKSIDNLAAGVYSATVTDVNGCTANDFVIVNEPALMLITTLSGSQPTCFGGSDAEVMAMISGGVAPYSFDWNTGATTQGLTFVSSGTYTLTVTDSRGCELSASTTVTDPAQLTISAVGQNALCSGTNSGAIDITVSGGNPGYKYEWSNGETTEDLTNVASGTYTVTVTDFGDEGGCSITETVTITSTPAVQVTTCPSQIVALMPGLEVDCHYPQLLNVIYNGVAGTTVKVYLETPPSKLLNTYPNVQPGQVLTASSMNVGEKKFKSKTFFTVDNGTTIETYEAHTSCSVPLLGLDFGDFHVTGFQNADGTSYDEASSGPKASVVASAAATGGVAPYTYSWSNNLTGSTINFNVAQNTTMNVTVTDANGCTATAAHQVDVVDIRSANYPDKVIMCHKPNTIDAHEHDVKIEDIAKKISEGWTLGPCGYDFSQPTACGSVVELPCECSSGVQAMALVYDGPAGVDVDFYNEDKIDASELIKSYTNVQPGDSLLAYSVDIGESKFSKFGVAVDGVFLTDFHISCSVPVQGLTAGDLTVYGFVDGDGNACHMPAPPASPASCDCDGKIIEMTVIYDGPANATVSAGPNSSGTNPYNKSNVNPGDTLIINLGNIGNDWYYLVNGIQDAYMHASCSDEIMGNVNASKSDFGGLGNYPNPDAGNNLGTFLVIGHVDDAGNVCTLQNYNPRYAAPGTIQSKLDADFINVFPNPTTGNVTLEYVMNANTNVEIRVLDYTGRTVAHKLQNTNDGMNSINMDLNHLANGVYFINLNNSVESKTLKFVVQK